MKLNLKYLNKYSFLIYNYTFIIIKTIIDIIYKLKKQFACIKHAYINISIFYALQRDINISAYYCYNKNNKT